MSKTFLDRLVVLDCGLCLINIIVLILSDDKSGVEDLGYCAFFEFLFFKVNLINKLLTVGIVIYRFTLVICSTWVQTPQQRKSLEYCILTFIFLTSFNLTSWAFYYREEYRHFLGIRNTHSLLNKKWIFQLVLEELSSSTTFTVTFTSPKHLADRSGPFLGATHFMSQQLSVSVAAWCWPLCFMRSYTSRSFGLEGNLIL